MRISDWSSDVCSSDLPREIRNGMNRLADAAKQPQAGCAQMRALIVHRNLIEKCVDRRAKAGERRHRPLEILRLHSGARFRFGRVQRVAQRSRAWCKGTFLPLLATAGTPGPTPFQTG